MEKTQINNFREHIYYEKLDNGLQVYILPLKNKKNYACMYVTKYGGRNIEFEVDGKQHKTPTGIAHFLEHKMFDRKDDPFKYYVKYGTDVNASTSLDHTGYYFMGNKCFDKCLLYLLNWLKELNVTDDSVEKEQGIILEEANMYKDNPDRVLYSKIKENVFVNDPSKYKVIGTDEDITSITKDDLELCFNTFYNPNNMYLIITGNVNPNKTMSLIKENQNDYYPDKKDVKRIYNKEPDQVAKDYETLKMNIEIPRVAIAYKVNKQVFEGLNIKPIELDIYLHCLFNISLGMTSEIREHWLKKNMLSRSFYRIYEIETHYVIELYAVTNTPDELVEELEEYQKDFKIDEKSFEREKKLWIAEEIRSIDTPMGSLYSVLDDVLDYKHFIPNKINIIKNLSYETLDDIKNRLNLSNKTIVKIMPDR